MRGMDVSDVMTIYRGEGEDMLLRSQLIGTKAGRRRFIIIC
jgi:hypothetical protein